MDLLLLPILPTTFNILFLAGMLAGIGNSLKVSHHEKANLDMAFKKNLSQENVNKNLNKIINKIVSDTIINNKNDIQTYLLAKNKMSFDFGNQPEDCPEVEGGGDFDFSELNQQTDVTAESVAELKNRTETKIQTEIFQNLQDIFVNEEDIIGKMNAANNDFDTAMEAGITGIKSLAGDATKVLKGAGAATALGIGKSTSKEQNINNDISLKESLEISDAEIISEDELKENNVHDILKIENINKILNEIYMENDIDIKTDQCISGATVNNIKQLNEADLKIKSAFLNEVVQNINNKLTSNIVKIFEAIDGKSNRPNKVVELAVATVAAIVAEGGEKEDGTPLSGSLTPVAPPPAPTLPNPSGPEESTPPATTSPVTTPNTPATVTSEEKNSFINIIFYVGIGIGVLLLIILILKLTKSKRRRTRGRRPRPRPRPLPRPRSRPRPQLEDNFEEINYDDNYNEGNNELNYDDNLDNYNYLKSYFKIKI